ncbi:PP2C family serine/threonine-protein phosphatase [Streptomyces sp. Da 82-17]|uniref:PP2C family serine/threonine-protein phosphatase n=1 Tax=Streptomyces sp. Da 82-17 TaxID=3377116 RepID=UPI0038D44938
MSQMHQLTDGVAGATCPSCAEPLESGDLFCGACGYDLSAVRAEREDHPTVAISHGTAPREQASPQSGPGAPVEWPEAPEADSSDVPAPVHLPSDLPGTDSGGAELTGPDSEGSELPGTDSGGEELRSRDETPEAPDPRTAEPVPAATPTPPAGVKLCVACRAGRVDGDGYCERCGHAQPRERDHMEEELDAVAAVSDRGLRHHRNEDAFAVSATALPDGSPAVVAVVCDGVSSATRPDEASVAAARAANESLLAALPREVHPQQAMHDAIVAASEAVNSLAEQGDQDPDHGHHQNAPACTIVASVVAGGLLVVGWVGDSRAYWVPSDRSVPAARLTEDDSWAAQMVAAGLMNEAEAYADERAHAITGWLGADAYELEPHTASFKPDRPGVVVVCTDGLWNYAEGVEEMAAAVPVDACSRPLHSAQVLVGHALDGGGHDNVTVAVLPFPVASQGAGSA